MKKNKLLILLIIVFALQLGSLSGAEGGEAKRAISAKVTDISDRKYEKAVIELFDNAKDSIVISMYSISTGDDRKNPVKLLLNDLLEARGRGVNVTMYLNSRFRHNSTDESFIASPMFKELEKAGCEIYPMPKNRVLHDKLIVVDNRYVVVGSTNWSNRALRSNFESNTLIDSPDHAKEKLKHLNDILKFIKSNSEISHSKIYTKNLPEELFIPKKLLINEEYFPNMVTIKDERAFDLYLLLLAHAQNGKKQEFYINLEDMGLCLGLPGNWNYSTLRRQVIKSLRKLQKHYNLITVKFIYSRDAHITLNSSVFAGEAKQSHFTISTDSIIKPGNAKLTLRLKFLLLIEAFLKNEGEDLYSIAKATLAKRFGVNNATISKAFGDLRNN